MKNKKVEGDFVATENTQKQKEKNSKKKDKKPGFFSKLGSKIKDVFSELKKVVWPSKSQVAKNTVIVIAAVIIIGIVIWVLDMAFGFGISKLIK